MSQDKYHCEAIKLAERRIKLRSVLTNTPLIREGFDFSFLEYPEEAIITLEEAGLTEQELVGRASAELPEYVQSGGYDDIDGITIQGRLRRFPKLNFETGKHCDVITAQ